MAADDNVSRLPKVPQIKMFVPILTGTHGFVPMKPDKYSRYLVAGIYINVLINIYTNIYFWNENREIKIYICVLIVEDCIF